MNTEIDVSKYIIEILERVKGLETTIRDYNGLKEKLDEAHGLALKHEEILAEGKDNKKWAKRTIFSVGATAIICTVLGGLLLAFLKAKFNI
jgi:hypothetical protein